MKNDISPFCFNINFNKVNKYYLIQIKFIYKKIFYNIR